MEGSSDPNLLAECLEGVFQKWIQLNPLVPRPRFLVGPACPDLGLPRFGVSRAGDQEAITIDAAYTSVLSPIILREVIRTFFPPQCLVDFIEEMINRFSETFLAEIVPDVIYDVARWQSLVQEHARTYHVHYLGSPRASRLDSFPHKLTVFAIFLGKLRQHEALLTPERVLEIAVIITSAISLSI